jgi:hypothetical protein
MPYLAVIALQLVCVIHLMRTGRNPLWLTALIFLPVVSAIAYLVVEVLPGLGTNRHVRTARAKAVAALDPAAPGRRVGRAGAPCRGASPLSRQPAQDPRRA